MTSTQKVAAVIIQFLLFSYLTLVGVGVMFFNLSFPLLHQITDFLSSRFCFLYFYSRCYRNGLSVSPNEYTEMGADVVLLLEGKN